ncbi:purine-cytosine permease family protein [Sediminispirochaeta smaragdinae]|uniref:Permease for cytosine/purines uracil thiamine allantoin n=1 Tax=Sediminispirochaeta smaragdinae (strain DSM 11293 / JCM 15392 / SEBR 4228) TaxID=573413 RepID=E1R7P3_SEDSS|nr:cytosine permease [Sediminispirochaeta smaragdinae]ADK82748.1 permease for cytosine/purines uracil thiamine allantoin [Sediminispirochaeta smaragdinae DSM 11293]
MKAYKESLLYDYPTEPVPKEKRRSLLNLSFVTAGLAVAMSTLYTGASLANLLTFRDAVWAIILGSLFLLFMAGIMGGIGADTGVPFSVLSRHAFGRSGSKIVGLVWAVSLTGWYAYQTGFFGQTMHIMFPNVYLCSIPVATVWGGLLMMTTAIVGYKGLSFLSTIASPLILIICLWGSTKAFREIGFEAIVNSAPSEPASLGTGITIVIGGWIVGSIMQPDVSRYVKTKLHNWIASALAMFVFALANFAGMVMVKAAGSDTIMAAMVGLGMGLASLLMVILAQWTSNDNNLYSASLGISNIREIPKYKISLILGIIATAIAFLDITDFFVPFLVFLGVFIPPIGGVIVVDYYFLGKRKKYQFSSDTRYRKWNLAAVLTVVISGIIAKQLTFGVAAINSFVIGGILYFLAMRLASKMNIDTYRGSFQR